MTIIGQGCEARGYVPAQCPICKVNFTGFEEHAEFCRLANMRSSVDDYLLAAWLRGAPNADTSRGFPRGFWPDVARVAVEMALGQPISIRQTMATRGGDEGRPEAKPVKGLDISKLEFRL